MAPSVVSMVEEAPTPVSPVPPLAMVRVPSVSERKMPREVVARSVHWEPSLKISLP